jgi:hypothetical protein
MAKPMKFVEYTETYFSVEVTNQAEKHQNWFQFRGSPSQCFVVPQGPLDLPPLAASERTQSPKNPPQSLTTLQYLWLKQERANGHERCPHKETNGVGLCGQKLLQCLEMALVDSNEHFLTG